MVKSYFLYTLWFQSSFALPLTKGDCLRPDVIITYGKKYQPLKKAKGVDFFFSVGPQKALFHYRDLALFTIKQGSAIYVSPVEDSDSDLLSTTLMGTPMGILLLQRGFLVLHASAVEINGKTVCFLGASGSGKSTTVLSLIQMGHRLVTDDVVAVDTSLLPSLNVLPGYPWMKVDKELISRFCLKNNQLYELGRSEEKVRYALLADGFVQSNRNQLACLYVLQWGRDLSIKELTESESLLSLLRHEYAFVPKNEHPVAEQNRFMRSSEFIKTIPCYALQRPRDLNQLHRLAGMIEEHVKLL